MGKRFEPNLTELELRLRRGLANADVREMLPADDESSDLDLARTTIQTLAACSLAAIGATPSPLPEAERAEATKPEQEDVSTEAPSSAESLADASLVGQLAESGAEGVRMDELQDADAMAALLRGGRLRERRTVLARILNRLESGSWSGDERRRIVDTLHAVRDLEIGYELARVRERLPGAAGRKARAEREHWIRELHLLRPRIIEFWETIGAREPLMSLSAEIRAGLLMRCRELPPLVIWHLSSVLEGTDGVSREDERLELVTALRYSGDSRLVPSLINLLDAGGEMALQAVRALRRISDPRVLPALQDAFERSVVDSQRAAIAGALAEHGDSRGREYVYELLHREESAALLAALEALETLGHQDDCVRVTELLQHEEHRVASAAIQTLIYIGDSRALVHLREHASGTLVSAEIAAIEDAEQSILARRRLRGEESELLPVRVSNSPQQQLVAQAPLLKRWVSWADYLLGFVWLRVGSLKRAVRKFEAASRLRPGWSAPLVAMGIAYSDRAHFANALNAFRRAAAADREKLERNPQAIRAMARAFLHRAEQVQTSGQIDIARGLVAEVLSHDLRRVPPALRFELERRWDSLGGGSSRGAHA